MIVDITPIPLSIPSFNLVLLLLSLYWHWQSWQTTQKPQTTNTVQKPCGQFNWLGTNHGVSQPTYNDTCQSYNIQNTVYWKSQTEIRHKQANSQAILSSECNLKTCFVRWFRDTIEKFYGNTHSPKYNEMLKLKIWNTSTYKNTLYAFWFTLLIYISISEWDETTPNLFFMWHVVF